MVCPTSRPAHPLRHLATVVLQIPSHALSLTARPTSFGKRVEEQTQASLMQRHALPESKWLDSVKVGMKSSGSRWCSKLEKGFYEERGHNGHRSAGRRRREGVVDDELANSNMMSCSGEDGPGSRPWNPCPGSSAKFRPTFVLLFLLSRRTRRRKSRAGVDDSRNCCPIL